MPKNKWKIARTALTKAPIKSSYNEYIDVETVLEDVLLCKGLDLCTYAETEAAQDAAIEAAQADATDALAAISGVWRTDYFPGVTNVTPPAALTVTRDTAHSYIIKKADHATGISYSTTATANSTTITFSDATIGTTWDYEIFYKSA